MKTLHIITFSLLVIGGINLGLTALGYNLIETIFSSQSVLINGLIGISAVYVVATHKNDCKICAKK